MQVEDLYTSDLISNSAESNLHSNNQHSNNQHSNNQQFEFKPCLIIPIYNHFDEFSRIVPQLQALNIPIIIIDDGSDESQRIHLKEIVAQSNWASLIHNTENLGKGATVCKGLNYAIDHGFTHALQVDADGQHQLDDVSTFIHLSEDNPEAIITAVRIYKNAPKSRIYGRKITDFWVNIHTLSFHIKDSMCGFRMYPLKPVAKKLNFNTIRKRMDFDTDILVKLYWHDIKIIQTETLVSYDPNISSHFKVFADNVRISWMHTRLFFGMLVRIPSLLKIRRHYA